MIRSGKAIVCGALLFVGAGLAVLWRARLEIAPREQHAERMISSRRDSVASTMTSTAERMEVQRPAGTAAPPPGLPVLESYTESRIRSILGTLPPEFHLSQAELEQLVDEYLTLQSVRSAHEMSIATVKLTDGVLDVVIPNYANVGANIRSMLQAKISAVLGPKRGAEAWRNLQGQIAIEFDMFGDSTQDLLATVVRSDGNDVVRIERTRNWTVSGVPSFATSVYLFDARQLEQSEYVHMAPLLRRLVESNRG